MTDHQNPLVCPRCEGQAFDKGSCGLCGNFGVLCDCGGRFTRTGIYFRGRPSWRCVECGSVVIDENEEPSDKGLVYLRPRP